MKPKAIVKILLDGTMTVLYALLMFDLGDGGFFHEVAGIAIGVLFVAHLLLNRREIKALSQRAGAKTLSPADRLRWTLDCALPPIMAIDLVTGVLMARALFTISTGIRWDILYTVHVAASWAGLALLIGHLALHAKYLKAVIPQGVRSIKEPQTIKTVGRFAAGLLAAAVLYGAIFSIWDNGNRATAQTTYRQEAQGNALPEGERLHENGWHGQDAVLPEDGQGPGRNAGEKRGRKRALRGRESSDGENAQSGGSTGQSASGASGAAEDTTAVPPTLNDFLGKMTCTGCGRRCLLTNPACGRGEQMQQQATAEYEATYGGTTEE